MKRSSVIASHAFNAVFIGCITAAAIHFDKIGLLWWYLLPAFCAFCTIVGSCNDKT